MCGASKPSDEVKKEAAAVASDAGNTTTKSEALVVVAASGGSSGGEGVETTTKEEQDEVRAEEEDGDDGEDDGDGEGQETKAEASHLLVNVLNHWTHSGWWSANQAAQLQVVPRFGMRMVVAATSSSPSFSACSSGGSGGGSGGGGSAAVAVAPAAAAAAASSFASSTSTATTTAAAAAASAPTALTAIPAFPTTWHTCKGNNAEVDSATGSTTLRRTSSFYHCTGFTSHPLYSSPDQRKNGEGLHSRDHWVRWRVCREPKGKKTALVFFSSSSSFPPH
jgi:hypothetical protein